MRRGSFTVFLVSFFVTALSCVVLSGQASALMYGKNDDFIGSTTGGGAVSHFSGKTPLGSTHIITPSYVWDAGTEVNDDAYGGVGSLGCGNSWTDKNSGITKPYPEIFGVGGGGGILLSFNRKCDDVAQIKVTSNPIPKPLFLLGTGLVGLAGFNRRKYVKR